MPIPRAASRIVVPLGTLTSRLSIFSVIFSFIIQTSCRFNIQHPGFLSRADGLEFTFLDAGAALDTLGRVDEMRALPLADNGVYRAVAGA